MCEIFLLGSEQGYKMHCYINNMKGVVFESMECQIFGMFCPWKNIWLVLSIYRFFAVEQERIKLNTAWGDTAVS